MKQLLLTYTPPPKPLLLTYQRKSKLELEYLRLCQKQDCDYPKCSRRTLAKWKRADKHRKEDLFALLHWREYQEQQKRNEEAKKEYYKPKDESKNLKEAFFVFDIEKTTIQKIARFHYFVQFLIVLLIDDLYYKNFGFSLTKLTLLIPTALLTVITAVYFILNLISIFRLLAHYDMVQLFKYVILRMGEPGTGKSSSGIYDAVIMAEKCEKELNFEYAKLKHKISRIYSGTHLEHKVIGLDENKMPIVEYIRVYTGNEDKIKHAIEVIEAYEYYTEHNCVPCLWSTVPLIKNGVPASKFTADHLLQKAKVLYKSVAFIDEIGSMLPPELSNNKIRDIDLLFRFIRHFKDFHIISTEQDGSATVVSARRVTAENKQMVEQKHTLKPVVLNWVTNYLENKFEKAVIQDDNFEESKKIDRKTNFIENLREYVDNVGFRKFKYIDYGNLQVGNKGKNGSRVKSFIAPPSLNASYSNRTFKNLYKCANQCAVVEQFTSLDLSEDEVKALFNEEIINRAYKEDDGVKKSA